jgi:hypothetical protein
MDIVLCNIPINKFYSHASINGTRSSKPTVLWGLTSAIGQAKVTNHAFHACYFRTSLSVKRLATTQGTKAHSITNRNYSLCVDRPLAHTATVQSLASNPFPVIMYPQCTYSKEIEHGTFPPHPLFNNPRTSGKQNFA